MSAERLACRTCPARAVSVNTTDDAVSFSFCVEIFSPTENINGIPAKKFLLGKKIRILIRISMKSGIRVRIKTFRIPNPPHCCTRKGNQHKVSVKIGDASDTDFARYTAGC